MTDLTRSYRPSYYDRRVSLVGVGGRVVALPVDTIDDEIVDMTVSDGSAGYGQAAEKGSSEDGHGCGH